MLWLLLIFMPLVAEAQEWQAYQLTNFPPPGQVRECSSVADTLGHIHHFIGCLFNPIYPGHEPLYYLRTDFHGNILTDTVRLNDFGGNRHPTDIRAVSDGSHAWCVFREHLSPTDSLRGLFLAERDASGLEVMPPTLLGLNGGCASAVLDPSDSTIHVVADIVPYYYRFTTTAETLIWHRPINGVLGTTGFGTSMILSPADGRPWASMYTWNGAEGYFLVVRFNEDTSQTAFHALEGTPFGPYHDGFGMDEHFDSHFLIAGDTVRARYVRVDSTLENILESRTLSNIDLQVVLRADPEGNCLLVWDAWPSLRWAFRSASGAWTQPSTPIDSSLNAQGFSVVTLDSSHYAFTCMGYHVGDDFAQLLLYTYGFPPNAASPPHVALPAGQISAYPNPFSSALQLTLPGLRKQTVVIYDLLGRTVWSQTIPAGIRSAKVNDPRLAQLPYGTYFLALQGHSQIVPIQITHVK